MDPRFTPEFQRSTILKISWRLLPLIVVSYLVAYIDRTNVAFAALHASVLAMAVAPALRLRRSAPLRPEPESRPAVPRHRRRWPLPAAAAALAAALLAASSLAVVGNRTLGLCAICSCC